MSGWTCGVVALAVPGAVGLTAWQMRSSAQERHATRQVATRRLDRVRMVLLNNQRLCSEG